MSSSLSYVIHGLQPLVMPDLVVRHYFLNPENHLAHNNAAMKRNITKGVRAELLAAEWLIEQGIWSFIPMSAQGPIDLVGVDKEGTIYLFDIKVQSRRKDGSKVSRLLKPHQKKLKVRLLYVDLKTKEVFVGKSQKRDKIGKFISQEQSLKKQ